MERTELVDIELFKRGDDMTDWVAYKEAQVDNGERCAGCGTLQLQHQGHKQLCVDCQLMNEDTDEVTHDKFIRCPKCGGHWDPYALEQDAVLYDGDHKVMCPVDDCEHEFEISTAVSWTFRSPARDGHTKN